MSHRDFFIETMTYETSLIIKFSTFGVKQYLDSFICTITGISLLLIDASLMFYLIICDRPSKTDNNTNYYTSNNKFDQIVFIQK